MSAFFMRKEYPKKTVAQKPKKDYNELIIPNLVNDCRLLEFVIPAKAGIRSLFWYYMQFFQQSLTVIGIKQHRKNQPAKNIEGVSRWTKEKPLP
jgi:hypothetical protein